MNFLLNNEVCFTYKARTLYKKGDNLNCVTLSRIESELLSILITHNNEYLTIEYLISEVWEKKGTYGSVNNLNNYISLLRKNLKKFFEEQVLFTKKKFGYKVSFFSVNREGDILQKEKEKYWKKRLNKKIFFLICLICLIIIMLFFSLSIKNKKENVSVINNCNFVDLGKKTDKLINYKDTIKSLIDVSDDECFLGNKSFIYLKDKEHLILSSPKKQILTICNKGEVCHVNIFNEDGVND